MPVIGGSEYFDATMKRGGQRRQTYHMARDQLALHNGEPPRGIQHMGETQTVHHPMLGQYRAVGSGMGYRDQGVRREALALARRRAMEYPMVTPAMRGAMEGSGWFSDMASRLGNVALGQITNPDSILRQQIIPAVKPHLGKLGKAGELAQQGLSLAGMGKPPHNKRMPKAMLMEAKMSGMPYLHGGAYYMGDKRLTMKQVRDHALNGGGFFDDVWSGIKQGVGAIGNVLRPVVKPIGNTIGAMYGVPMAGTIADAGLGALGMGYDDEDDEKMRGGAMEGSGVISNLGIPVLSQLAGLIGLGKGQRKLTKKQIAKLRELEGSGVLSDLGIPVVSQLAGLFGLGKGELEGGDAGVPDRIGYGRRRKMKGGDAGVPDRIGYGKARKPNARAEIVKKVMREKGMSMIEASKYVKQHGLY